MLNSATSFRQAPIGDMSFDFFTTTRIVFGRGVIRQPRLIGHWFGKHPLVVTGRDVKRAEPLLQLLRGEGIEPSIYPVDAEPTIAIVDSGVAIAKEKNVDGVIGFGGGSALDAGKAIAVMATNEGELLDYLEVIGRGKSFTKHSLPFLAIPTTSGTGAEVTRNAVIGSLEHRAKASLRSQFMQPRGAVIDPELTFQLPPDITAASGMDALTQLIEPFVCSRANPITDALCREAIPRAARSLPVAFENGMLWSAREDMSVASLFGGLALSNAGLGAVHGFANPIGGMFSAPHGAICAALLPQVMEMNLRALRQRQPGSAAEMRYTEVAKMLTGNTNATAEEGAEWVHRLVSHLRIPRLKTYKISEADFEEIVTKAQKASSMKANPVELTPEELREILARAL